MSTKWKKPINPPEHLTQTDNRDLPVNQTEGEYMARTRRPLPNNGTYGDRVFPGCHHTSDPADRKTS
jgi:hypothetical protein